MAHSDSNALGISANLDTEVGKVVVDLGLATKTEIEFCRSQQKEASDPNQRSLADLLIEHNFITVNQAKRIRSQLTEKRSTNSALSFIFLGRTLMATMRSSDSCLAL